MRFLPLIMIAMPLLVPSPALAQQTPIVYAAKADITAAIAKAAATLKPGQTIAAAPVLMFGTYRASVEYRTGPTNAAVHQGQNELFQVIEGSGTLTTGGALETSPTGVTITGGTARHVAAGDVFVVPAGTPHGFGQVDGHLVLLAIKLPAQ